MNTQLEIIIPTYNRSNSLASTLEQLLAESSPVKECRITILDNASEDTTPFVCEQYQKNHPSLRYIRHPKNIGMGANICRALELAEKPYYWLIGDDENYDFTHWSEVEKALQQQADCIVVADFTLVERSRFDVISQLGLLSAGIYKTEHLSSEVLQNAYANILNMFPHMALICHLFNKNATFFITSKPITLWGTSNPDPKGKAYIRGAKSETLLCPRLKHMHLIPAWYNCLQLISDAEDRSTLINRTHAFSRLTQHQSFFKFIKEQLAINKTLFNDYFDNSWDLFKPLSYINKVNFLCALMWLHVPPFYKKESVQNTRSISLFWGLVRYRYSKQS
jgi:glycosyltransferase involved in cell wall biosynthesis